MRTCVNEQTDSTWTTALAERRITTLLSGEMLKAAGVVMLT